MTREEAIDLLVANTVCSNSELTCFDCPYYDFNIASNEDNVNPCKHKEDWDDEVIEAVNLLRK